MPICYHFPQSHFFLLLNDTHAKTSKPSTTPYHDEQPRNPEKKKKKKKKKPHPSKSKSYNPFHSSSSTPKKQAIINSTNTSTHLYKPSKKTRENKKGKKTDQKNKPHRKEQKRRDKTNLDKTKNPCLQALAELQNWKLHKTHFSSSCSSCSCSSSSSLLLLLPVLDQDSDTSTKKEERKNTLPQIAAKLALSLSLSLSLSLCFCVHCLRRKTERENTERVQQEESRVRKRREHQTHTRNALATHLPGSSSFSPTFDLRWKRQTRGSCHDTEVTTLSTPVQMPQYPPVRKYNVCVIPVSRG